MLACNVFKNVKPDRSVYDWFSTLLGVSPSPCHPNNFYGSTQAVSTCHWSVSVSVVYGGSTSSLLCRCANGESGFV